MNASKICILTSTGKVSHKIIFAENNRSESDSTESIYHTQARIHPDDSIRTIKMKLLYELHKGQHANQIQLRPSYEELYLYGFVKENTTTLQLFDALKTEEDSNPTISRNTIQQMIEGHPEAASIIRKLPEGDKIPYSDFESALSEKNIEVSVKTPLGITFAGGYRDATFEVDPFNVEKHRAYLAEHNNLHYLDDSLLLNHGTLTDATIFVCLADRVYEKIGKAAEEYVARYYFPGLYKDGITSKETLTEKRGRLVKSTQKLLSDERSQYYESIDTFYKISEDGDELQYISQGIRTITFQLKNQHSHHVNLEMLFKNMHCSKEIPYIKFNPGNRREKLYRFYFERTTRTGKKIPYLTRSHIMRMSKETGRGQQISIYLEGAILNANRARRILSNCYLHLDINGNVQIQLSFHSTVDEKVLDETVREQVLPFLSDIGRDVRETGFKVPEYHGLRNIANTKIIAMTFECKTAATKKVNWESIPCIYSICTLNTDIPGQPLVARLKRVENFREMDAAHILIAELYGQVQYGELVLEDIVNELVSRGLSENENAAKMVIAGFMASINEMNGEVVEKPGFPIEINIDSEYKTIEISISELTSIYYLDTVGVYIDAIIKTTQIYKESNPLLKQLKKLCKKSFKFKEKEKEPEDVPLIFNETRKLVDEGPLKLSKFAKEDDFFAQFESDEGEDEYEDETGRSITVEEIEEDEDTDNLLNKLRKNAQKISTPIMFDEESEKEEEIPGKSGPIMFEDLESDSESDREDVDDKQRVIARESLPAKEPKAIDEIRPSGEIRRSIGRSEAKEETNQPKPTGPIMFDFDEEEEESGGAKKTEPAEPAELLQSDEEEDVDVDADADAEEERLVPDGMPLKPVNPFLKKLRRKDPVLFMSKPSGNFKSFSTSCQPTSRHPVILNQEEMDRTDKSAYKHAIKYGSDPKKPNYFICPRFWCFLTNSAISEEDVKAGKCGTIISKNADKIPKGSYVYELNEEAHIPGFIENKLANGKCLPCCFKKTWDNKTQTDARRRCESQMNGDNNSEEEGEGEDAKTRPTKGPNPKQKKQPAKALQYIISLDTYPISQQRWGFLPIPVQLFFQIDYRPTLDPNNPALLKPDQEVFLRYGVEQSLKQSFLGCFADIYAHRQGLDAVPTVEDFRRILREAINLDVFVKAHNGSLLSAFYPKNTMLNQKRPKLPKDDRKKYKDTEFALALDLTDKANKRHFDDAILAYENFLAFLSDQEVKIDHQYLWDFVCDDNSRIIPKGLNLVILEIKANDIIDRIELVCPTNLYSRNQYDTAKDTVILLKHDEFYEPIYMYESTASGTPKVTRFFLQGKVPDSVSEMLKRIEHATRKYCPGLPSLPKIYRFSNPIPIQRLLAALTKIEARIESQVINYQGKTIGLMVVEKGKQEAIYVPCAPSARLKLKIKYMDSPTISNEYEKTAETLNRISSTAKIPCKPVWKIKEDGMVVGFLTETNQFVPIKPNEDIIMDGLQTYEGVDVFAADKTVATEYKGDKTRIKMTKYIVLESQFYHAFRNRVRTLLNQFANRNLKNEIRNIAEDRTIIYKRKIEQLEPLIERLIDGYVVFVDIANSVLIDMAEVNECDDADDEGPNCIIKENGVAQLVVPKRHLISDYDNEKIYVGRMADELIRNDRVKSIMYDTANRLNAKNTDYKVKDDEFILVQSALTPEYFSELDSTANINPYTKNTNYELAGPSISVAYPDEKIPLSEQYQPPEKQNNNGKTGEDTDDKECLVRVSKIIGNQKQVWDRIFSEDAREHIFRDTATCTFIPIIRVAESKFNEKWSVVDVKNKLSAAYLKLFEKDPTNLSKVAKIMKEQGKTKMFERFTKAKSDATPEDFSDIVISDNYHLTDIDIWVLSNEYNLPVVVFNANGLKGFFAKVDGANINTQWIKMGGNKSDDYHFIRSKIRVAKSSYANHVYEYNLVVPSVKLSQTKEFEGMVVESTRMGHLNTTPLEEALERFF